MASSIKYRLLFLLMIFLLEFLQVFISKISNFSYCKDRGRGEFKGHYLLSYAPFTCYSKRTFGHGIKLKFTL